jgi:subtilisin family serine protease
VVEDVVTTPSLIESTQVIDADLAWADGYEGAGQTVAVLDTGVDRTHPFVDDAIVREACFSANRDCPNGQTVDKGTAAGVPCTFSADCGHGTHVAGIAVGEGGPGGMRGVAPDASLISMNVFSNLGGDAVSYPSDQIAAMEHAYQLRDIYDIAAVNMSLGGGASSTFCDDAVPAETAIIENLRSAGIATAIASGNDGLTTQISFPACISSAISVGSTTDADLLSFFGNAAFFLDLVAPGGVGSGAPDALNITSSIPGGGYDHFAGTSMATPHVAGAFALLGEKAPRDTVGRLLTILQRTGVYIPDVTLLEYPRIRPHDALTWMPDEPPNPGFSDVPTGFPFYVDIAWAAFNEVTDGFDDNTFRPGGTLTRQALVAFLYRLLGSPPGPFPNPGFSDVPTDHPFYTEIAWAKANDITDGFTDGTFRPGAGVPRQALAAFLYRLAGEPDGPFPNPGYSDVSGSHPFRDEIRWAAYSEITQGFSNGTFRPVNLLTRQAAVAFLYRFEPWLITT